VPAGYNAGVSSRSRSTGWSFLGRVPYEAANALQAQTVAALRRAEGGERLLLLEHPHVYTLGRNASSQDLLADAAWLAAHGVTIAETNRGGQMTYHGPGQLVGYPILDLNPDRRDIRRYVRDLVEVLVRTLAEYGIAARAGEDQATIGVWTDGGKIASVGVHLSRWITSHGFALNVTTELDYFGGIVACGLPGVRMCSIASLTGTRPTLAAVAARVAHHFGAVFERSLVEEPPPCGAVA
jgi:lipoyl(octanoyl) transferase